MTQAKSALGASSEVIRGINRRVLLNLIRTRQPLSRADLARISGLQRSTVSLIVEDLVTEDWVIEGPTGRLPLTARRLRAAPSGEIFGLTQNAGMGWDPRKLSGREFLILSTQGGIRAPDGSPPPRCHPTDGDGDGPTVRGR